MKLIKLPPVLPGNLDLAAINQELREGRAKLDWSGVQSAPDAALAVLLAGIDSDSEVLNIDEGVSDRIIQVISNFLKVRSDTSSPPSSVLSDPSSLDKIPQQTTPKNPPKKPRGVKSSDSSEQLSFVKTEYVAASNPEKTGSLIESKLSLQIDRSESPPSSAILPPSSLLNKLSPAQIRAELEEIIINDLLGPVGGETEEIDENRVGDRYLVGVLAPLLRNKAAEEGPEEQDDIAVVGKDSAEEGTTEKSVATATTMFPSSMGLTFCVEGSAEELEIAASWGKYEREKSEIIFKENGDPKTVWKRYPITATRLQRLKDGQTIEWVPSLEQAPEVFIKGQTRRMDSGDWIVTLFLVNGQQEPAKLRDRAWVFQPQLIVRSPDQNHRNIFIKRPLPIALDNLDPMVRAENEAMGMLYRRQVEFAVGHGVSVDVVTQNSSLILHPSSMAVLHPSSFLTTATELKTSFIPSYEVPKTTPPKLEEIPELAGLSLDMKELAQGSPEELPRLLNPLPNAYQIWIEGQRQRFNQLDAGLEHYQEAANRAIANCEKTLERIQAGIAILQTQPQALKAFQFANEAMWQQRLHSLYAEKVRRGETPTLEGLDLPKNRSWYPFQLAFVLLNLPSLTDLHHGDRTHPTEAIADLLWFPTGGGKTEAYLGLTAYTLGIRRLQGIVGDRDGEHGVAVLMRYTLRLLTLQQFQRATTLICACESIRRQDEKTWGREPFRIGLWVGQNSTPNYTAQSEEYTKQERGQAYTGKTGSPHQLTNCPWCGTAIDPGKHIHVDPVDKGTGRTLIKCGDAIGRCIFAKGEGLPVIVVDEEIYRRLPSLLIATVDKFAQMPWKGEVQMLFGQVNGYCDRHGFRSPDLDDKNTHKQTNKLPAAKTVPHLKLRPPDLIIQDELHLISGPLGTLVGLYETAVDELASWEINGQKIRPKVVASTATIRQAETQVYNLFLRKLQVFPPQALDIEDNFFSRQRDPSEEYPGRRYLGICAPGKRLKAAMIRVYVAALAAAQTLYEKYGKEVDPWMTLVGYFNSLRELGGTRRLVEDDIRTRLGQMDRRGLAKRYLNNLDELTSRKDSTEIPVILDKLEIPFDPDRAEENQKRRKAGEKVKNPDPLDVILATNMISVGVDVKRLGIMVVCGQPKNTAEYIQATSRVGRTYPGLVLTVYNWARPRDLSHYERFQHYHATFYQNVEALSVTPFAPGALYRGLTALLVSLIRLGDETLNGNEAAGKIERDRTLVQQAIETIVHRAEAIGGVPQGQAVRRELEAKLDRWLFLAQNRTGGGILKYRAIKRDGITIELLKSAGNGPWQEFTCLNSLRNVEPPIGLIFTDEPPDDESDRLPQPYLPSENRS
ncbi:DISARM system helicase DrmA [Laspinema olomoucense]|uniref:DISARM system helicase DrmA n=1 Tax=Laspinema olomoucense TaxID=3231600 RepID=UPI0021BB7925|nr:DISARM system helicase DrmA [Laspinema sp. D3c]MCT7992563.1 DISARM system helicase DrmA [Laspinema sp. D3c]